jgi:hypothetical protein
MIRHGHIATGTNDATKQVSVTRWNEDHVIEGDVILPTPASEPPTPAADTLSIFARKIAGRMMLAQRFPS